MLVPEQEEQETARAYHVRLAAYHSNWIADMAIRFM